MLIISVVNLILPFFLTVWLTLLPGWSAAEMIHAPIDERTQDERLQEALIQLTHAQVWMRRNAIWALGQLGAVSNPRHRKIFELAIKDPHPTIRGAAIYVLGESKEAWALPYIIAGLDDPSEEVRMSSVGGLVGFDASSVISAFDHALEDLVPGVRLRAAQSLRTVVMRETTPMETKLLMLEKALKNSDAMVRDEAANAAARLGPKGFPLMERAMEDENEQVRGLAMSIFGPTADNDARPLLTKFSTHRNPTIQKWALGVLERLDSMVEQPMSAQPFSPADFYQALKHPDSSVNRGAVQRLYGSAPGFGYSAMYLAALTHRDAGVRRLAIEGLESEKEPMTFSALTLALGDTDPRVRRAGLHALGVFGDHRAAASLTLFQKDPDPAMRGEMVQALARLRAPETTSVIIAALDDPDPTVRETALHELSRELPPIIMTREDMAALVRKMPKADSATGWRIWRVLCLAEGKEAASLVCELLQDPDSGIRLQTLIAIQRILYREGKNITTVEVWEVVADAIGQLLEKETDPTMRSQAIVVLKGTGSHSVPVLTRAFPRGDDFQKRLIVEIFGHLKEVSSLSLLAEALEKEDLNVQTAVMGALEPFGPEAVPLLRNALHYKAEYVWIEAMRRLLILKDSEAWEDIIDLLHHRSEPSRRATIAFHLGESGERRAVPALKKALKDIDPAVRLAARKALDELGEFQPGILKRRQP